MPPKRMTTRRRVASNKVQGAGSFVVVCEPTVEEMRELRQRFKAAEEAGEPLDSFEEGVQLIKDHIIKWNWVDDDGSPLPQVPDEPDIVDRLTDGESRFLAKIFDLGEKTKN